MFGSATGPLTRSARAGVGDPGSPLAHAGWARATSAVSACAELSSQLAGACQRAPQVLRHRPTESLPSPFLASMQDAAQRLVRGGTHAGGRPRVTARLASMQDAAR